MEQASIFNNNKNKTLFQEFNLRNYTDPQVATANLGWTDEQLRVTCS